MEHREHGADKLSGRGWIEAVMRAAAEMKKAPAGRGCPARAGRRASDREKKMTERTRKVNRPIPFSRHDINGFAQAITKLTFEERSLFCSLYARSMAGDSLGTRGICNALERLDPRRFNRLLDGLIRARVVYEADDGLLHLPLGEDGYASAAERAGRSVKSTPLSGRMSPPSSGNTLHTSSWSMSPPTYGPMSLQCNPLAMSKNDEKTTADPDISNFNSSQEENDTVRGGYKPSSSDCDPDPDGDWHQGDDDDATERTIEDMIPLRRTTTTT